MSLLGPKCLNDMFSFWAVAKETASSSSEPENSDELEQITIARALSNYRLKEKMANPNAPIPFPKKFPVQHPRPTSPQPPPATTSKILPLICQKAASRHRHHPSAVNDSPMIQLQTLPPEGRGARPQKFPALGAAPYVPIRQMRTPCHGIAPPVTIRTAVPVFSAPPLPPPAAVSHQVIRAPPVRIAPPVTIRQAVPVFAAPPVCKDDLPVVRKDDPQPVLKEDPQPILKEDPPTAVAPTIENQLPAEIEETGGKSANNLVESETAQSLKQLKI